MLLMREVHEDADRDMRYHETPYYRPFTDDKGRLFRSLQREFGRCTGKVYAETKDGDRPVGWTFQKKEQYTDTGRYGRKPKYYTRLVWVMLAEVDDDQE
jgi:hypothetical protein